MLEGLNPTNISAQITGSGPVYNHVAHCEVTLFGRAQHVSAPAREIDKGVEVRGDEEKPGLFDHRRNRSALHCICVCSAKIGRKISGFVIPYLVHKTTCLTPRVGRCCALVTSPLSLQQFSNRLSLRWCKCKCGDKSDAPTVHRTLGIVSSCWHVCQKLVMRCMVGSVRCSSRSGVDIIKIW